MEILQVTVKRCMQDKKTTKGFTRKIKREWKRQKHEIVSRSLRDLFFNCHYFHCHICLKELPLLPTSEVYKPTVLLRKSNLPLDTASKNMIPRYFSPLSELICPKSYDVHITRSPSVVVIIPLPWPDMVLSDLFVSRNVPILVTLPIPTMVPFSVKDTSVLGNPVTLRILILVTFPMFE